MDKKYKLTNETINVGQKPYRIKALKNFGNVKKVSDSIFLIAEIHLNDIITIQRGKIRCKKATILEGHQVS